MGKPMIVGSYEGKKADDSWELRGEESIHRLA
jgi:hypothetical protein